MNESLINILKNLKNELIKDGFIIEGVFGSFARGENNDDSDFDILYELNPDFISKYKGFDAYNRLNDIENYLSKSLNLKVDTVRKSALGQIGKKYILKDVQYV